jgi:hypothetical protein
MADSFSIEPKADVVAGNFTFETHSKFEEAVVLATFAPGGVSTDIRKYHPSSRSVAFTKQAWKAAGGYPEWLYAAEDTLFNIRLRQLGFRFFFCRDAIVRWRPRSTWRRLARQRFGFSRGNARVGMGTQGYLTNIKYHLAILLPLAVSPIWPPAAWFSLAPLFLHIRRHLWTQSALAAKHTGSYAMLWRVLTVMAFVRLIGVFGYLFGRWDRLRDSSYAERQKQWMGVDSIEKLPAFE